ncbi:elongation factor Ts [Hepatocystis sp. ex Piliocolobus tephrosceles]|nr:elongation factor Ts [Hepatocystis sp. ex Piliocolobus tephrosceles]
MLSNGIWTFLLKYVCLLLLLQYITSFRTSRKLLRLRYSIKRKPITRVQANVEHLKNLKYVREMTNASIQLCNKALKECNYDPEKAIELVRKQSKNTCFVSTVIKTQKEGLIGSNILKDTIVLVEVLTDSDFVSRNIKFINFVKNLTLTIVQTDMGSPLSVFDYDTFSKHVLELPYVDLSDKSFKGTVKEYLNYLRNIFREDIKIGRLIKYKKENKNEFLHFYIHNSIETNLGLSGVLLVLNVENLEEIIKIEEKKKHINNIANDLAMHILSAKPISITINNLNKNIVQKEMDIIRESLKGLNKSENIINNMISGKMRKFYATTVLMEQEYMLDETKRKVSKVIQDFIKTHNINIGVKYFDNFTIGEKSILKE